MVNVAQNPITDICVLSDKKQCPPGFEVIYKAQDDTSVEADLWKESFWSFTKTVRFLAVSRQYRPELYVCTVVADLVIVNDGDVVPSGFVPIENTRNSNEKSFRKKVLCMRMQPRESAVDAVCDVVVLSKMKRAPSGYTLAGEIDDFSICCKYATIPENFGRAHRQQQAHHGSMMNQPPQPHLPQHGAPYGNAYYPVPGVTPPVQTPGYNHDQLQRQNTMGTIGRGSIDDVPFELHPTLKSQLGGGGSGQREEDSIPPQRDISTEILDFDYPFSIENSLLYSR